MTTTAPPRSLELPPVALSARPLRLDLPRFQLVRSTQAAPVASPVAAPVAAPVAVALPAPAPAPVAPLAPVVEFPPAAPPAAPMPLAHHAPVTQSAPLAQPTSIAPVVATPSLTRRDGTLGLAIGILVVTLVLAAALAMQRSMHGWPPGMH